MRRIALPLLAWLLALTAGAPAQYNLYWEMPTTPGGLSLGAASLLISTQPEGLAINPASLAEARWRSVRASGLQWWQDIYAGSVTGSLPAGSLGHLGLGLGYWSFGSIPALGPMGEPRGSIESRSFLWGVGLGRNLFGIINTGLALKGYTLMMPDRKDWSWAGDVSCQYGFRFLTGTFLVRNLGPKFPVNNQIKFDLPTSANIGLSARLWNDRLSSGLLWTMLRSSAPVLSSAAAIRPIRFLEINLGYDNDQTKPQRSSLGFGLAVTTTGLQDYRVEYGYRSYGALGNVHAVSLGMDF